jgi:hypothetical protein
VAASGAFVVSGAANRLDETCVIEAICPIALAGELMVVLLRAFVADGEATGW